MAWLDWRTQQHRSALGAPSLCDGAPLPEVFVVEADVSVRASLVWLLDSLGIGVLAFDSMADFLRQAQGSPGCMIVDVELRSVDKLAAFADELRNRGLVLPIVAMSADPFLSADDVHRVGAIAFLPKPFSSEALVDSLRTAARSSALAN